MKILSAISGAFFLAATFASPSLAQSQFPTEQQAQQHCTKDVVVWLNLPTRIYHMKGERWYGMTKSGAYVCEKEADLSPARRSYGWASIQSVRRLRGAGYPAGNRQTQAAG
jgi:hypothetical protein